MYRKEVPLYGDLVDIVRSVDSSVLSAQGQTLEELPIRHQLERHGAIRLGTEHEMRMIKRLFGIMGMQPVGYYNLEMVGFPLHGTAFRPTSEESLRRNPFRVFTTVLRPDLISSNAVRKRAVDLLSQRTLFSPRLLEIMHLAETKNILDTDELISEALKIFKWHSRSIVPWDTYLELKNEHPMVADIVCFPSAHINHLTPRTLDIDAVQTEMICRGLPAKDCIEGPPKRACPILLRQTSFKALEERVTFGASSDANIVNGTHTARFGEVEQRGAAVTRKGRELYDRLLAVVAQKVADTQQDQSEILAECFAKYPDDWNSLRKLGLVYFRYKHVSPASATQVSDRPVHMEELLQAGVVECEPITYEDFLPFSAAGIFTSNLGEKGSKRQMKEAESSLAELEESLGCTVRNELDLYEELQAASVHECGEALGLKILLL